MQAPRTSDPGVHRAGQTPHPSDAAVHRAGQTPHPSDAAVHQSGQAPRTSNPTLQSTALSISSEVNDDDRGWSRFNWRAQDYDPSQMQEIYQDALTAWRKNPIAWRIIAITTDYVVGDELRVSSPYRSLDRFISRFWNHPKNQMDLRLQPMSDELARSGDLFILLFRNPQDGMSYIRFVTKDRIGAIQTAENDWETELSFSERCEDGSERTWLSPSHPQADQAQAVMLHYAVNRPLGALLGESDLTTMIPWLQRYSRMLEDRVRLHWAVRAFLWLVTVPANKVKEKQEQYRLPPESGSIVVHDESENWLAVAPNLHGSDASADLKAVRGMIDAGSGYPPHWRGEAADANLATATAMQAPTERHLLRRQQYFTFLLQDLLYHAYLRSKRGTLPNEDYQQLFVVARPDISRTDNEALARAARDLSQGLNTLASQLSTLPPSLARRTLRLAFKFAGEPLDERTVDQIMSEIQQQAKPAANAKTEKEVE